MKIMAEPFTFCFEKGELSTDFILVFSKKTSSLKSFGNYILEYHFILLPCGRIKENNFFKLTFI